jgi:opacity protein-like surface antigen
MRNEISTMTVALTLLVWNGTAQAQRRMPAQGASAVSVSAGVASPSDLSLRNGFTADGSYEYYTTPRISIRVQGGAAWGEDFFERGFTGSVQPVFVDFNGVYNWEGGKWHPFATGGLGINSYHFSHGSIEGTDTRVGGNVGGGVEYFFTKVSTVKLEGLYHGVSGRANGPLASIDPSFWTFTAGLKHYF